MSAARGEEYIKVGKDMRSIGGRVAQSVERCTGDRKVPGSNPGLDNV